MTHVDDKTWQQQSSDLTAISETVREAILHAKEGNAEWLQVLGTKTLQQLADKWGVPLGQVTEMANAYNALLELFNVMSNVAALPQADRLFFLRKFS
jgi:phage tail protein X